MALRNWDRNESTVAVFGRNFKPVTASASNFIYEMLQIYKYMWFLCRCNNRGNLGMAMYDLWNIILEKLNEGLCFENKRNRN